MPSTNWTTFKHPHEAYRLEHPAEWETLIQDEAKSCGFGPKNRDDVGLWISILPMSVDTDRLAEDLPKLMEQSLANTQARNLRADLKLHHHALKADITTEGEAGHYWILAGGDLVLFASSQVPVAEREIWNPAFDRLMASLRITREDALLMRKVANETLLMLREKHPEQNYDFDKEQIRGRDHVVYLGNLYREVKASPDHREQIVRRFVEGMLTTPGNMGYETWDETVDKVLPVLKPRAYVKSEGPTQHLITSEWLADVIICYAIRAEKAFRFITGWDCDRWGIDLEQLHARSIENLAALDWPKRLEGSRQPGGGRIILVLTDDSFSASRLLHPEFHKLFSGPLGSPFLAGIPDRDTLVALTNRDSIRKRIAKQVKKDYNRSAYAISPRLFLVTADGVALADVKDR